MPKRLRQQQAADLVRRKLATSDLGFAGYAVTVLGAPKASAFVSLSPALIAMVAAVSLGEWPDGMAIAAILVVSTGVALASGVASGISFKRRLLPQQT